MDTPALATLPADMMLGQGQIGATATEMAKRGHITETAQNFEASFLSNMLQTMFEGVSTDPPFGGGEGEQMWKSFMAGAMAKQMVKSGGIGISKTVAAEMLKMQGLGATPGTTATTPPMPLAALQTAKYQAAAAR